MNLRNTIVLGSTLGLVTAIATNASAAGYEKSIMFGGKSAGLAGVATPYISGSQALFFNPAGLVKNELGNEMTFNLSPTYSKFKSPIVTTDEVSSDVSLKPILGVLYSRTVSETLAFGIGAYNSAGTSVKYQTSLPVPGGAEVSNEIAVTEVAAGLAYKVTNWWRVGAAWRIAIADARFAQVSATGAPTNAPAYTPVFVQATYNNLKDTRFDGFKVGTQFDLGSSTRLGVVYRSELKFNAEGDAIISRRGNWQTGAPGAPPDTKGSATVETRLPMQATVGLEQLFGDSWAGYLEYSWTNYKKNEAVEITGTGAGRLVQDWKDQTNVRVAGEYLGFNWPVRFGYGWTSEVTNADHAAPTFTPPGNAHTVTAGSGFTVGSTGQFDFAGEYTFVSGDGNAANGYQAGTRKTDSIALHMALTVPW